MARHNLRPRRAPNAAQATANARKDNAMSDGGDGGNMPDSAQRNTRAATAITFDPPPNDGETFQIATPTKGEDLMSKNPMAGQYSTPTQTATPTQSKCHKVLNTTELLEHILTSLSSDRDLLRCICVSTTFKNTIRGSIKLQRRLFLAADNTVLIGTAVNRHRPAHGMAHKAENGGRQGVPATERLLRTNPFIIRPLPAEPYGEDQYVDFSPNLKKYFDHKEYGVDLSIGEMFLTQPPVFNVRLAFGWWELGAPQFLGKTVWLWLRADEDGVKVKDVKKCFQEYLGRNPDMEGRFQDALKGRHDVALKVKDSYEVMDLGVDKSDVVYTDDTMPDDVEA